MAQIAAPGSWRFGFGLLRQNPGSGIIATFTDYDRHQQLCDGHLIEAAPDLYAAARGATAMLEGIIARCHAGSLTIADAFAMIGVEAQKLDHVVRAVRATPTPQEV